MLPKTGCAILLAMVSCIYAAPAPFIDSQPACTSGKLDLVLVVDVSGSQENRFITNRDSALELARAMPISWDRAIIAVIQYSKLAIMKLQFGSSEDIEIVNDTISTLEWTGGVAFTAEAMDLAMIQFRRARTDSQRVILLFSDGNSLNSWKDVQSTAERLHYSKAKIFAVSLTGNTYEPELKVYTSFSNGSIIKTQSDFEHLKRELLSYTVSSCRGGAEVQPPAVGGSFQKHIITDSKHIDDSKDHSVFMNSTSKHENHPMMSSMKNNHSMTTNGTATTFVAFPKKSTIKATTAKTTMKTTKKPMSSTPSATGTSGNGTMGGTTFATTTEFLDPEARQEAIEKQVDQKH